MTHRGQFEGICKRGATLRTVTLKFSDRIALLLTEVCEQRDAGSIESLFLELARAELAGLRLTKLTNRILRKENRADTSPRLSGLHAAQEKRRISAEKAQVILERIKQGIGAPQIALREGVSIMTVHRIRKRFEACRKHVQEPPPRLTGKRGAEISGFNNHGVKRQNA